jgi:uncharacterized membrane protein YfcA
MAVWVGASAAHRNAAFAACRDVIDELKRRVPIWKREHYADGTSNWVSNVEPARRRPGSEALLGGTLGGFSGVIGIGGGIFLAPVLHLTRWGPAKQTAATASLFILFNSLAGLAGKAARLAVPSALGTYAPLFAAVLVGGQVGSRLGARRLPARWVKRGTALVVLIAAVDLLVRSAG